MKVPWFSARISYNSQSWAVFAFSMSLWWIIKEIDKTVGLLEFIQLTEMWG